MNPFIAENVNKFIKYRIYRIFKMSDRYQRYMYRPFLRVSVAMESLLYHD